MNRTTFKNLHFSWDVWSYDQSRFLFFEMRRIRAQNYFQNSSFVMWCTIISSISLSLLRNQQNRWTELSSEIFICYVMFDHLINLTFSSSKWPEYVKSTMLRNLPLPCEIRSSDESCFRFFEIGRIAEENYKPIIIHFSCDVRSYLTFSSSKSTEEVNTTILRNVHLSCDVRSCDRSGFFVSEVTRIHGANYAEKSSITMRYSIIW
jgi:hypothetical protein